MAFVVPTFNLACNIWRQGNDVQANPADVTAVCNLTNGRSGGSLVQGFSGTSAPLILAAGTRLTQTLSLLLPKLTDIRGNQAGAANLGDCVEVPAGSGRFYLVLFVDDVGKGFANEHREAVIIQATLNWQVLFSSANNIPAWPYPTP